MAQAETKPIKIERRKLLTRWSNLKSERASWMSHWQEISNYVLPRSGRFFIQDRNRGERRHNNIYDSTGTRALRVLGSGMMSGATSPARPWFRLATPDAELNKYHPVKMWLSDVTKLMQRVFSKSNTYPTLHSMYEELGCFATTADIALPDYNNVIHHYFLTAGEYALAADYKGRICTLYREFEKQVGELVKEFGRNNCSTALKNLYDRGELDQWIPIIHVIEPRADRDPKAKDNKNMAWGSYYFEVGGNENQFLRESGFSRFPVLAPRWQIAGGDIYGNGPGMECLGDIKQLQHEQLRKGQGIDYQTKPPLQVPAALKGSEVDTLPGGFTYYDPNSPHAGVKNLFEVTLQLDHLLEDIRDVRERIRSAFYADLFLMLANAVDTRMTATEVAVRNEEKLIMLGPVLERLHNELLNPLIDITFTQLISANVLPPPPPEMKDVEINVEFISMLAQAQRAIGVNSVDRWVGNLGAIAAFKPDIIDKFDADNWADAYADMLGVDPEFIVANDKVALIRKQRAETQAQAQQAAIAEQQSKTVANLGGASMGPDSVLKNVMDSYSGYNTPGVLQ